MINESLLLKSDFVSIQVSTEVLFRSYMTVFYFPPVAYYCTAASKQTNKSLVTKKKNSDGLL